jgi:hypothetical protein
MSGPPYPPLPGPGSNGIGEFAIGESQIGDIAPFPYRQTILSQYANSPIITQLIDNFFAYLDQTQNLDSFYDLIMNLDTAQGYGLDVWGRIVGVNRVLQIPSATWFGFQESLPGCDTWNDAGPVTYGPSLGFAEATDENGFGWGVFGLQKDFVNPKDTGAPLYSGESLTQNYTLSDKSYRLLIIAKAAANITNGSIPAINKILVSLFPNRGNCYVTEGAQISGSWFGFQESTTAQPFGQAAFYDGTTQLSQMTMSYVFKFTLSPVEYAIVANSGVLPKSTGVAASIVTQ